MSVEPNPKKIFETLRTFAEMIFSELGLTVAEIESQSLPELELSLATVRTAILRPESFGTVRMQMTAEAGMVMVNSKTESHLEMTILPILLEREKADYEAHPSTGGASPSSRSEGRG